MLQSFDGHDPVVHPSAWVHERATVIGEVRLGALVSIWPGVVLRGDEGAIEIGDESNIQDNSVVHNTGGLSTTKVGARCTVGHKVILHGCIIEDDCLIGMGAIILDNTVIGAGSIVGAGALVTANKVIPPGSLVLGSPARVKRQLTDADREMIAGGHKAYVGLLKKYANAQE